MVTAETLMVTPFLIIVLSVATWLISGVVIESRAADAAQEAARQVARGESVDAARSTGHRLAPAGSTVDVDTTETQVTVRVHFKHSLWMFDAVHRDITASSIAAR